MASVALFNVRTNRGRQQARIAMVRQMAVLERVFAARVRRILQRQYATAARQVSLGSRSPSLGSGTELVHELRRHYQRVLLVFGRMALDSLGRKASVGENYWSSVDEMLGDTAAITGKIKGIDEVTRARIHTIVSAGVKRGRTGADIAKEIQSSGGFQNRRRAMTIARTETHAVATFATDKAMESTGLKMDRVWVSALDTRTRATHRAANDQVSKGGKPFEVGGHKLDRPGDPKGPPQEVINCRCVLIYEQPKEAVVAKPKPKPPTKPRIPARIIPSRNRKPRAEGVAK